MVRCVCLSAVQGEYPCAQTLVVVINQMVRGAASLYILMWALEGQQKRHGGVELGKPQLQILDIHHSCLVDDSLSDFEGKERVAYFNIFYKEGAST